MSSDQEDKIQICMSFVLRQYKLHQERSLGKEVAPLFIGLNGVQGCGKTTLVSALSQRLIQPPDSIPTLVLSIDDLYLPHQAQCQLAKSHPANALIRHRGQPSTHDLPLALSLLSDLSNRRRTQIPSYDKCAFAGQGDRIPQEKWRTVNAPGQPSIQIVLLEGWCVGFRALSDVHLQTAWSDAVQKRGDAAYEGRLGFCSFEDVDFVNKALRSYDELTDQLNALIHIDAADPLFVYGWRQQQEKVLRESRGSGMTESQVTAFVNGYYPAYELYVEGLRGGSVQGLGKQLRMVIDQGRKVQQVVCT